VPIITAIRSFRPTFLQIDKKLSFRETARRSVMPNTHRRRDSTVELRRVGVSGVNTIRNELTTTADGFGRQFGN